MIIKHYSRIMFRYVIKFFVLPLVLLAGCVQVSASSVEPDSLYSLSEIYKDLDADEKSDLMGERVTVSGIATVGTGLLHENYLQVFIQQDDAGLSLYSNSFDEEIAPGDSVVATGVMQDYYGLTEINVEQYEVHEADISKPNPVKLDEVYSDPAQFESMLVEGEALVVDKGSRFNGKYLTVQDADQPEDSLMVYVSNFHSKYDDFNFDRIQKGDEINVSGILSIYSPDKGNDQTHKIFLRTSEDLSYESIPNVYIQWGIWSFLALFVIAVFGFFVFKKQVSKRTFSIKRSLKQKEMLLQEVHHRVKNNLAIISGLIEMQIYTTEDEQARQVLRDSQTRIRSMAMVHEKLYSSENLSDVEMDYYIKELVDTIAETFQNNVAVSIEYDLDAITLSTDKSVPCGLLINEIVVNAFKHAFSSVNEGKLLVSLKEQDQWISIQISDNGPGIPKDVDLNDDSLGMMLIKTFTQQLNGEIDITSNGTGTTFSLVFEK